MKRLVLKSIGAYVPQGIIDNNDLERLVDTSNEWILERTGIRERRKAGQEELTHHMAIAATRRCLEGITETPDLLVSSTLTPGRLCPYQASIIAKSLKLDIKAGFDINAACSGFLYGLAAARGLMETMGDSFRTALITASEKMTAHTDYSDRKTCVLFGDGAAALLVSSEGEGPELEHIELGIDAAGSDFVSMGAQDGNPFFDQDGPRVYRFAVTIMNRMLDRLLEVTRHPGSQPYHVIFHQANLRMMQSVAETRRIPFERFLTTVETFGNTSSASVGLTLDKAWRENRFRKGDRVFLIAFGGGLSWAAASLLW